MLNLNIKLNDKAHDELLKVQKGLDKSSLASTIKASVALTNVLLEQAVDGKITVLSNDNEKVVIVLKIM